MRTFPLLLTLLLLPACAGGPKVTNTVRQKTDRQLDLAINGEGFFVVQTTAGGYLFTRAGALSVATSGELVNVDGYRIIGPVNIPAETSSIMVTPDGVVRTQHAGQLPEVAGQIILSRAPQPSKMDRDQIYYIPNEASGDPITGRPGTKGLGTLVTGALEQP